MNFTRIRRDVIHFDFVPHNSQRQPAEATDRLYLDCGNGLGPGVIDHHHLPAYTGSTAGLIVRHPELVIESVGKNRDDRDPFVIFTHDQPDLDCVVSAALAVSLLTNGTLPTSANVLANYVDRVDAGHPGFSQQYPFTLYSAYMLLVHDQAELRHPDWQTCLRKGVHVVEHVLQRVEADGKSIPEIDAFACHEVFRPRDRREIEQDLVRYRAKLRSFESTCRPVRLRLPGEFGGQFEVDGLLARDVQNINDPERCVYFKDWARTDSQNSSQGKGFVALSVFISESPDDGFTGHETREAQSMPRQVRRSILSVSPGQGVTLRGLGALLEKEESVKRIEQFGFDNRATDQVTRQPLAPRKGFDNSDPWYDGRGHNYTIVDSPRGGTILTAEQIEQIFIDYGAVSRTSPEFQTPSPLTLSSRDTPQIASTPVTSDLAVSLNQLSTSLENWSRIRTEIRVPLPPPEIFISYPRLRLDWVESRVAKPLAGLRGGERVFFDKNQLQAGMGWLEALAEGVMNCRLFLAVFCPPYFQSDFCQWELQLALTRDPTGRKRIIAPIMLEPVELPAYCRLIQAELMTDENVSERLLKMASEILD